jgi:hypothetical protein
LASAVECGDPTGVCSAIATAATLITAAALTIAENIVDLYTFIGDITGVAQQDIANANVKVLLGTWMVGIGGKECTGFDMLEYRPFPDIHMS